ncbi:MULTISPECIES: hypothetical protein [Bacillus]|nr:MULTISPECIES: hypothetical protein [Bacillus]
MNDILCMNAAKTIVFKPAMIVRPFWHARIYELILKETNREDE